jgi:hypothetical protein
MSAVTVTVLERVTLVTPLALRFRDEATRTFVSDRLLVSVHLNDQPERRTLGIPNNERIFIFQNLPFIAKDVDLDAPKRDFVLEVRDLDDRYIPFTMPLTAPQRGIFKLNGEAFVPLFSSPNRAIPDGLGALRAELVDRGINRPAAYATVEAKAGEQRVVIGMADKQGRLLLPLFYPKPLISLEPNVENTPLTDQTWAVDFKVRYRRRTPVPEIPDLADVLAQPLATAFEQLAPETPWTKATLRFGRELQLASKNGNATTPTLSISS